MRFFVFALLGVSLVVANGVGPFAYNPQAYPIYPLANPYNPYAYYGPQQRFGFNLLLSALLPTTTITSTSLFSITCTVSTNVACGGKRKRSIFSDDEIIEASPVNEIVPTEVAEPTRAGREANPQYFQPAFDYYQPNYNLQSTFDEAFLPQSLYSHGLQGSIQPRWGLTITRTSTAFSVTTVSSRPTCSVAGTLPQCPQAR